MASRLLAQRTGAAAFARPASFVRPTMMSVRAASGNGGYNEPTGWLFGEDPNVKRKREDWEIPMYLFGITIFVTGVFYAYSPQQSMSEWATKEAEKRLDERGEWRYKPLRLRMQENSESE